MKPQPEICSVFPVRNSASVGRWWWWLVVERGSFPRCLLTHIQTLIKFCRFCLLYISQMYLLISTFVLIFLFCVSVCVCVCVSLWECVCECVRVCVLTQLCLILYDPMDPRMPASLSMGFLRQEYWSGLPIPPPVELPNLGTECMSLVFPTIAGRFFFTTEPPWKSLSSCYMPSLFLTWTITMIINWSLQFSC